MIHLRALLVLLVLPAAGCSSSETPSSTSSEARPESQAAAGGQESAEAAETAEAPEVVQAGDPAHPPGAAFFTAEGAPDPLACTADADCTYAGAVNAEGCCWSYRDANAVAMSAAYRDWQTAHRAANCDEVACPPPPVPTRPEACLFEVSCVDAQCQNACNR